MHKLTKVYGFWFYEELREIVGRRVKIPVSLLNGESYLVNCGSPRLRCLKRSPVCVACGKVGEVWILERDACDSYSVPHFNLYAIVKNKGSHKDGLTLMTQDHIVPRAHGGTDAQSNVQTFCTNCNGDKGCSLDWHGGQRPQGSHRVEGTIHRCEADNADERRLESA
jgi:hypothetical protein